MDIKKKKIIKFILIIILLIIILLLWSTFLGRQNFSKYKQDVSSNSTIKVAKPIFVVEGADKINNTIYSFCVKNYDNTGISDVGLNYYIQIEDEIVDNLKFILKKDGNIVPLNSSNRTNLISLAGITMQEDNYELEIRYSDNSEITSDISGNLQVKVEAVQSK